MSLTCSQARSGASERVRWIKRFSYADHVCFWPKAAIKLFGAKRSPTRAPGRARRENANGAMSDKPCACHHWPAMIRELRSAVAISGVPTARKCRSVRSGSLRPPIHLGRGPATADKGRQAIECRGSTWKMRDPIRNATNGFNNSSTYSNAS